MRRELEVSLIEKLVAIRNQVKAVGVDASIGGAVIEQGRPSGAKTVSARDGHGQSVEVASGKRIGKSVATVRGNADTCCIPLLRLLAFARQSKLETIVEGGCRLVVNNS